MHLFKDGIATGETEEQPEASLKRINEKNSKKKIKLSSGLNKNGYKYANEW